MNKIFVLLCILILMCGLVTAATAQSSDSVLNTVSANKPAGSRGASPTPVPEPTSIALLAGGLAGLYGLKKRFGEK